MLYAGHEVVGVDGQERDRVPLRLADGRTEEFDLVVFADRYRALGRKLEDALIWSVPDFGRSSTSEMEAWWQVAAKLPEELFPSSAE